MLQLKKRDASVGSIAENEFPQSHFIPYECHFDSETIITKDRELLQIVKIEGFSFETADDEELDLRKNVRNSLFRSMTQGNIALWFHTVRRKKGAYPGGLQPRGLAKEIDEAWKQKHENTESFQNDLYISVLRKPDTKGAAKLLHWMQKIQEKADPFSAEVALREAQKELKEVTDRVIATLHDYGARRLGITEREDGPYSEALEFLAMIINCGQHQDVRLATHSLDKYLSTRRLYFGPNAMEVRGLKEKKYAGMVSIKEYCTETAAGMFDNFLKLPFEFVMCQSFVFTNRQVTVEAMKRKQNQMINAEDVAISQIAEISDALDVAMSGHAGFGAHHATIMAIGENLKELDNNLSMCIAEMVSLGINATREGLNLEPCYWSQLPGNYDFVARKAEINTLNLSGFASMHNYPTGHIANNQWGPAVTVLDTASGTPYFFNFHLRDVGHTMIIGPTGAGKTVLMNFLCAQAQKFNARMFMFDKDRGADIFVRALGGVYNNIEIGRPTGFNPLKLPDTQENRAFLLEWLKVLVTINDEPFTAEDLDRLKDAIDGNYKLDHNDRKLSHIAPFLGLDGPGTLAGRIRQWHTDGPYAKLFDNDDDLIDFDESNLFGFEMGDVLANKATLAPTLMYLFHRINLSLDGTPTMVILDEAWALIDNPIFSAKIKDWLKTLRKLNAMVVFATQSVEDASKSTINDTLLQQTATQVFLPNAKATTEYQKAFLLSNREFQLIKETDPGSRFFLLKQGSDVVVARLDLAGLEEIIPVLSGRAETVVLCDEIRAEYGEDPDVWLPIFREKVKRL